MTRRCLTGLLILVSSCLSIHDCHAWPLPPVAEAGYEIWVKSSENACLDGSGSYDPDGYIASWQWTFGHPPYGYSSGSGYPPSCVYHQYPLGDYWSCLTVWDNSWASDSDYVKVYSVDCSISCSQPVVPVNGMAEVSLSVSPSDSTVMRAILRCDVGYDHIQVFTKSGDQYVPLSLPAVWGFDPPLSALPGTIYVKGIAPSQSVNDVQLMLQVGPRSWWPRFVPTSTTNLTVVQLQITKTARSQGGDDKTDFSFDSNTPGVCTVYATGTTGFPTLDSNLRWSLGPISGSSIDPNPGVGANVILTYSGLPSSTPEFGPKTLRLWYVGFDTQLDADAEKTIRVFYEPGSTNNPGPLGFNQERTPYWFCYWKEGRVVPDLADANFVYDSNQNYGLYDPGSSAGQGQLRVGPKAGTNDDVNEVFRNHFYSTRLATGRNGVNDSPRFLNPVWPIDDVNLIDYNKGEPNAVAIVPGTDGILQTQPKPGFDDERVSIGGSDVITTGPDGRLNTLKHVDDEYQVYLYNGNMVTISPLPLADGSGGGGKPGTIAVEPGQDQWLDLYLYVRGDDEVDMSTLDFNDTRLNHNYIGSWQGVDICAITCLHEIKHMTNDQLQGADSDDDGIPNDYEGSSHSFLNYCIKDTYNVDEHFLADYSQYGDDEFLCRMKEMDYVDPNSLRTAGKTDPDKDWSKGGKRWQTY